jgi:hypothetical protein
MTRMLITPMAIIWFGGIAGVLICSCSVRRKKSLIAFLRMVPKKTIPPKGGIAGLKNIVFIVS